MLRLVWTPFAPRTRRRTVSFSSFLRASSRLPCFVRRSFTFDDLPAASLNLTLARTATFDAPAPPIASPSTVHVPPPAGHATVTPGSVNVPPGPIVTVFVLELPAMRGGGGFVGSGFGPAVPPVGGVTGVSAAPPPPPPPLSAPPPPPPPPPPPSTAVPSWPGRRG